MTHPESLQLKVDAEPAPQGSLTAVYNRALGISRVRHSNAPALSKWRALLAHNAKAEGAVIWDGPIGINIEFGITAPQDKRHGYPKRPDLDKLVRAVLDALTGVCYKDDSQVVLILAEKSWRKGTLIEVYQIASTSPNPQATLWQEDAP